MHRIMVEESFLINETGKMMECEVCQKQKGTFDFMLLLLMSKIIEKTGIARY